MVISAILNIIQRKSISEKFVSKHRKKLKEFSIAHVPWRQKSVIAQIVFPLDLPRAL